MVKIDYENLTPKYFFNVENCPIEFNGKFKRREDYSFEEVFTLDHLFEAMELCASGKMWKDSTISYLYDSHTNVYNLYDKLHSGRFYWSDFRHYVINERGKIRKLCTIPFEDRIVQKTYNLFFLLPSIRPRLIYDNMASLKDKGPKLAKDRTIEFMSHMYNKYGLNYWIYKFDIKQYFDSMFHPYIMWLIRQYTTDDRLLFLLAFMLNKFTYDSFVCDGYHVPYGIGLGGEVPQTIGVLYLNEMDHIIKEVLRIHAYVRYQDDFYLMHHDKEYLEYCFQVIQSHLFNVGLRLNMNKTNLIPASNGFNFLKFRFFHNQYGTVFMNYNHKGISRTRIKFRKLSDLLEQGRIGFGDARNSVASSLGYIKGGISPDLYASIFELYRDIIEDPYSYLFTEEEYNRIRRNEANMYQILNGTI